MTIWEKNSGIAEASGGDFMSRQPNNEVSQGN